MRYLLDTHVVLWWYLDSPQLKPEHKRLIANLDNEIYVSAAVIWEIEVKRRNGKLSCPPDMMERGHDGAHQGGRNQNPADHGRTSCPLAHDSANPQRSV